MKESVNLCVNHIVSIYLSILNHAEGETIFVGIIQLETYIFLNLSIRDNPNSRHIGSNLGSEKPCTHYLDYTLQSVYGNGMQRIR